MPRQSPSRRSGRAGKRSININVGGFTQVNDQVSFWGSCVLLRETGPFTVHNSKTGRRNTKRFRYHVYYDGHLQGLWYRDEEARAFITHCNRFNLDEAHYRDSQRQTRKVDEGKR